MTDDSKHEIESKLDGAYNIIAMLETHKRASQREIFRLRGILHRHHICYYCGCGLIRADGDSCDCPRSKK